ncbi:MAG: glycine--tRNA ligase subunit beta, partial [Candidatus Cloacimonetes bacterium]|nr:glycine--tRNA ligase subunit beta [Candidatus Cloacimonadota bacterium]
VLDNNNNLTNKFVFISNGNPEYSEIIKQGNEKVVRARLEDAKFYYNEDTKRPLKAYVDKLDNVVFQAKLGTLSEKTQRVNLICTYISEKIKLNKEETLKISEATILSKADLVTLMLGEKEFTKLQGYIGMYYALQSGIENDIATAIYEHYMPRGQNDDLPSNIIGAVLSIADKFDTLCGIIGVDLIPTGSNDPFALRRAANGIVQIIDKYKFDLSLNDLVEFCFKILESKLQKAKHNIEIVKDFVKQRIKWLLEINNIDFDVINALDIFEWDNIVEIKNRAKDLQKFKTLPQFITLVSGYKRVSNILEKNQFEGDFDYTLLVETNEKILTDSLINLEKEVKPLLEKMQYHLIMEKIVPLGAEIDAFFDKVLVMCDDEKLKNNRLALLNKIKTLFLQVADISKINYENQ